MFATIIAFFLIQSMVFGNDFQKPDEKLKDDTTKKCSKIEIEVKEIEAAKALTIRATTPSGEISAKLGELYQALMDCINKHEIQMVGPPFAKYYSWDPEGDTDLEAGVPVEEGAECEGDVGPKGFIRGITEFSSEEEVLTAAETDFEFGLEKARFFWNVLSSRKIVICSRLRESLVEERLHCTAVKDPQEGLEAAQSMREGKNG